jgi:hypothetical protein
MSSSEVKPPTPKEPQASSPGGDRLPQAGQLRSMGLGRRGFQCSTVTESLELSAYHSQSPIRRAKLL